MILSSSKQIEFNLSHFIQFSYFKFLLIFTFAYCLVLIPIFKFSILLIFFYVISFFVLIEIFIHLVFIIQYGKDYKNTLFLYTLIDNPLYGFGFRNNFNSKKYLNILFDNYLFKPNLPRVTNKQKNIKSRLMFTTNSLSFRNREFSLNKNKKLRIFCTGGSTTAGEKVDDNQTWPEYLNILFKDNGYDVEVINAGVMGWYSAQELARFKKEIVNYTPDILLMHQGWNEEFEFSSLDLGKNWIGGKMRNVREVNNLYCKSSSLISQKYILSLFLLFESFIRDYKFKPNMSFLNPKRWKCLKNPEYLCHWLNNLITFGQIGIKEKILIYNLKYPGLVNLTDSKINRDYYVNNSRLTDRYADYQAISKHLIDRVINKFVSIIPFLDGSTKFYQYCHKERMELFHDEIHLTSKGNFIFANEIYLDLIKKKDFQNLYKNPEKRITNIKMNKSFIEKLSSEIKYNPSFINEKIDGIIADLCFLPNKNNNSTEKISTSRYTTY